MGLTGLSSTVVCLIRSTHSTKQSGSYAVQVKKPSPNCVSPKEHKVNNRKSGLFVVLGLIIGGIFGFGLGAANANALLGTGIGALAGVFMGWFMAAAVHEKEKK